jgi:hypothetical protein
MHAAITRREAFRRTRRVAAGVGLAGVLTFMASTPGGAALAQTGDGDFNNGTGNAIAAAYKVNPIVGNLSFGITTGLALAGHQNTAAQGQSAAVDMGVIGTTLAAEGCMGADPTWAAEDQPQPVIVFSNDEGAEQGVEEDEAGVVNKFARAHPAPFAEAITTINPMGDPAVAFVSGGQAIASSGVIDGNVREARAYTRIGSVTFGGGAVELRGLEWEAIHRSGRSTRRSAASTWARSSWVARRSRCPATPSSRPPPSTSTSAPSASPSPPRGSGRPRTSSSWTP